MLDATAESMAHIEQKSASIAKLELTLISGTGLISKDRNGMCIYAHFLSLIFADICTHVVLLMNV